MISRILTAGRRLLVSLLVVALASTASAVVINDDYFTSSGGDVNDVAGTLDAGYADARAYSYEDQFQAVGTWGHCTGTWIGNDVPANKSYFLTAAHCFQGDPPLPAGTTSATFTDYAGNVVASGDAVFHLPLERTDPANHGCGGGACSDIGIIELNGVANIFDSAGHRIDRPRLYDGSSEAGVENTFVGYGSWGIGSQGSNGGLFPSSGPRRAAGTNVINGFFESGKGIGTDFDAPGPGATIRESAVASGDSGSAWWQQHDGRWAIIATTNGGSGSSYGFSSTGARVSRYIDWIESVYFDAQLWSWREGDVNGDGFVNGNGQHDPSSDDVAAFIAGWRQINTASSPNPADLNGDGIADLADWAILRANHSGGGRLNLATLLGNSQVPEPGTLGMATVGTLALVALAARRARRN